MNKRKWFLITPLVMVLLSGCFFTNGGGDNNNNNNHRSSVSSDPNEQEYYEITWRNNDGEILYLDSVRNGEIPSYPLDTPVYAGKDDGNAHNFVGWSPELGPVTQDMTYTAQYETIYYRGTQDGLIWERGTKVDDVNDKTPLYDFIYIVGYDPAYTGKTVTIPETIDNLPVLAIDDFYLPEEGINTSVEEVVIHHKMESVELSKYRAIKKITIDKAPDYFHIYNDVCLEANQYNYGAYVGNSSNPYLICVGSLLDKEHDTLTLHPDCEYLDMTSRGFANGWNNCRVINIGENLNNISFPYYWLTNYSSVVEANIEEINLSSNNKTYKSVDGVVYSEDLKTAIYCPFAKKGALSIPEGVEKITGYFACFSHYLTSITFPETLIEIQDYAFAECAVRSLYLPDSLTLFHDHSFQFGLETIRIGKNMTYYNPSCWPTTIIDESTSCQFGSHQNIVTEIVKNIEDSQIYEKGGYKCLDVTIDRNYWLSGFAKNI